MIVQGTSQAAMTISFAPVMRAWPTAHFSAWMLASVPSAPATMNGFRPVCSFVSDMAPP